jgi:hypothetical protein
VEFVDGGLVVCRPVTRSAERTYILDVMLSEFLGLDYSTEDGPDGVVTIRRVDDPLASLTMPDTFFATPDDRWLRPDSLPARPLTSWHVSRDLPEVTRNSDRVPVLYHGAGQFEQDASGIRLNVDLFGSAFFMLTRYEEIARPERDNHDRFAAHTSLAYQEGFLDRPVVNEWLEVLRCCMSRLWPSLRLRTREFRMSLSHDVDNPWTTHYRSPARVIRSAAADIVHRREPTLALRRVASYATGNIDTDPANRFDWIMDRSESAGTRSVFYFIARAGTGQYDADYTLGHPWIQRLMSRIHARGHQIGLHTSYDTFRDPVRTREETDVLRKTCAELGIDQTEWGVRQHYLRWENPTTWRNADEAGFDVDSTLGFADRVGFRCGTCYEYPVFDLLRRQPLRLRERPLIAMEVSLRNYQKASLGETGERMTELADTCRRFGGDFVLLWHNDSLVARRERATYSRVVADHRS